jgi:hypothetical protein
VFYIGPVDKISLYETLFHCNILSNHYHLYRAEMRRVKDEMDSDGVFHPQANAHRVHCIYLLKLYKGISAHTIEDPVLKRLRFFFFTYALLALVYVSRVDDRFFNTPRL